MVRVARIKEKWNLLSLRNKMLSLTVIICTLIYVTISIIANCMIAGLSDQQAAKRWSTDKGFAQVSCFFSSSVNADTFMIRNFEKQLEAALKEAAIVKEHEKGRLYLSAYSGEGKLTVISELASLEANAVGVGGDFFFFHPLRLLKGGYFSGNDLMKDFILLDEEAAWRLFGSYDVEGMSVMIGGVPHYIAGVYHREEGRIQEAAGLKDITIFVSHETLSTNSTDYGITSYELVAPNPVKNFLFHTTKEKFGLIEDEMAVVENSSRFRSEAMLSVIMNFGIRSMKRLEIQYPYWENIARGYEDIKSVLFILQVFFLTIPSVILLTVLIKKGRVGMRNVTKFLKSKLSIYSILLIMAAMLTGCGNDSSSNKAAASKEYVYQVEELSFGGQEYQSFSLLKGKERLYAYSYNYGGGETNLPWIDFFCINEDGTVKEKNKMMMDENSNLNSLCPDGNGNVYAIKNIYATEPNEDGMYQDEFYLVKLTEKGDELYSINLTGMPELQELNEDYFYTNGLVVIDNNVYISAVDKCIKFDEQGNFVKILEAAEGGSFDGATLYPLADGKVAAITYEEDGVYASYVDLESGVFSQKAKLPGTSYEYSVYSGIGYDLYLVNSYGVFGYNVGEEDKKQLMNYIDSDLGVYSVFNVIPIDEASFFATYDNMETYEMAVGKFTKVPPEEVKEKIPLVLACAGMDWNVRSTVVTFNKNNEEYRILVEDYSSLYGNENDYMAGINRLNADIVAGKIPDILLIDSSMPVDSYIAKGLLADIKPYLEADEDLDITQFMPNIIEAFSVDGKLYRLAPSFMVHTLIAKTSDVGNECGWSVKDAQALLASKPEGTQLFPYTTREQVLQSCLITDEQFIDRKTGKCRFDSQEFIDLLEFSATFPNEINEAVYADDYWENYESQWREGKVLCQQLTLSDFRNYNYIIKGTFGEPVTMIGYPAGEGKGTAIMASVQLAMSAKSKNIDGAYEFLRYFLTDEYQQKIEYGFPVSVKCLDAMAQDAMKVFTYTDENGQMIESPEMYYLNGMEIEIEPMTEAEAEALKENLYSITNVYTYDENLMRIIEEESAAFFSGQKKAKDVADIIQSRVQIYVNENR